MPGWVDSPKEEKAWKHAKEIVGRQRKKKEADFTDRDWGLVTHVAQNILKSSAGGGTSVVDEHMVFALAKVERILDARRKDDKKKKDADLPPDTKALVESLSQVMAFGGQSIAALRDAKKSGMEPDAAQGLAEELQATADKLKDLLAKLKG